MSESRAQQLIDRLSVHESCLVAFSGGVDSAVVAKAAQLALGDQALAVTGVSASLAQGELDVAVRIAAAIGIQHETLDTDELADQAYLANQPDRCFHCKTEWYGKLMQMAQERGIAAVVAGANRDDLGDYRPGLQAAADHQVGQPLAECGLDKQAVRQLARYWDLEIWDKPATPCLSSRVVYGLEITPESLAKIDAAEQALREMGLSTVRVRLHQDGLARLEVPVEALPRLCEPRAREQIVQRLRTLGFNYVTLDLEGFRSGSFHQLIEPEPLGRRQ